MKRYQTSDDVRLRLYRSVVGYGGVPVHVDEVSSSTSVIVTEILTGDTKEVKVEELDLSPATLPLGYVIDQGRVFLTSRKPCRRFKQGLTSENFFVREPFIQPTPHRLLPTSRSVAKTMVGNFPDIGEAFSSVRAGKLKICPFSREWAVGNLEDGLSLIYRDEVVGHVGDVSVSLNPERSYLKEALEMVLK